MAWLFSVSLLSSQVALRSPRLSDKAFFLSLSPASLPPAQGPALAVPSAGDIVLVLTPTWLAPSFQ